MPAGGAAIATYQKKEPAGSPGPPFALDSADNGLSVDPNSFKIVLGQDIGQVGDPAQLLSDREIPMNGFGIEFFDIGEVLTGIIALQASAAKDNGTPFVMFTDSLSNEIGRINFLSDIGDGGDGGSVYIGRNAGAQDTFPNGNNVAIGWRALEVMDTGFANTAVGYEGQFLVTSGQNNTSLGASVFGFLVDGSSNTSIGSNSGQNLASGINNSFFGAFSSQGFFADSSNNCVFGSSALMIGAPGPVVNGNSILGSLNFVDGGASFGNENVIIGFNNSQHAGNILDHNIVIGSNNNVDLFTNSTIIGNGITCSIDNVIIFGREDQSVIIGAPVSGATDSGNKVQVYDHTNSAIVTTVDAAIINILGDAGSSEPATISLQDTGSSTGAFVQKTDILFVLQPNGGPAHSLFNYDASGNWRIGDSLTPDADTGAAFQISGDIETEAPLIGSAGKWRLGQFEAGAVVPTDGIRVTIDGVDYLIPAVAA